ncbi:FAD/NAD(P)-binding domain-containing protein [Basidiobolus meristosporus CBS 931.73]|uniref:Kynurenine 3-monooxygenase n=1 Tax=Basidiobolus meristosporus CBS 931.73 TaxID=1314790 RepID=A0A1Y1Z0R3_9FUNG|nr:FAD/NAD(P)-binding domain-containing protein [Basidiobolus meristosporus CBS 931.73]|eukprot:ORY03882.1 FAD/NAD(P)-binding domain-containing protein [Basidiobolus meristosporus CBS 931.73]
MSTDTLDSPRHVAVIGAGLVGSLASIYFAKRGWKVYLFDKRSDPRVAENADKQESRSINLALSARGILSLECLKIGIEKEILSYAIPMKGRMIHSLDGAQTSQAYSINGECINSVERSRLNNSLLNAAEKMPNVEICFNHSLQKCDMDSGNLEFVERHSDKQWHVDFIVGADGAYSTVRKQLMRKVRMNYNQEYIEHEYCELTIPPTVDADGELSFAMDPNHLHIWPKHSFMMIALPNPDKTFTATLFMPSEKFASIKTEEDLLSFFKENFPDSIPLIGEELLKKDYFANPKGSLMCVKCAPYHYKGKGLIIGDAAHSMVPFYGQGMNCGFEDVRVLNNILNEHSIGSHFTEEAMEKALSHYSNYRHPDCVAIIDLAMYNYIEMRSSVVNYGYLLRKKVESFLHGLFPLKVIPLYTMVSFSPHIRYSEAIQRWRYQGKMLTIASSALICGTAAALALGLLRNRDHISQILRYTQGLVASMARKIQA